MTQTQQGSAAPLSRPKDAGDNGPGTEPTRTEQILDALHYTDAPKLYPGQRLELREAPLYPAGTILHLYVRGELVGRLHEGITLDDLETWGATVALTDGVPGLMRSARLTPFPVEPCGCIKNFGGWLVRRCDPHAREADELAGDLGAYDDDLTDGDPRSEQERIYREVAL